MTDAADTAITSRALNKEERNSCWKVRNDLFHCLNEDTLEAEKSGSNCKELRNLLGTVCPASWVKHFLTKHHNDRQREAELRKKGAIDLKDAPARGDAIPK